MSDFITRRNTNGDFAILEDRNALVHSKGLWKEHKYIKKIGEGADAIYKYAKDKTGVTAKEEYDKAVESYEVAKDWEQRANQLNNQALIEYSDAYRNLNENASQIRKNSSKYIDNKHNAEASKNISKMYQDARDGKVIKKNNTYLAVSKEEADKQARDWKMKQFGYESQADENKRQVQQSRNNYKKSLDNYTKAQNNTEVSKNNFEAAKNNKENASKRVISTRDNYYNTPLGRINNTIEVGKYLVDDLLNKFKK